MKLRLALLAPALVMAGIAATPAQAAPKVIKTTISAPGWNLSASYGTGYAEGNKLPAGVRQTCPGPGSFDGNGYRFFDLGTKPAKSVKMSGPTPAVSRDAAGNTFNEYDIDIYGFDAKCERVEGGGATSGTTSAGFENFKPKKPARFLVIDYHTGVYPNIEITLEITQ